MRADAAAAHLARELTYLALIAGAATCLLLLVALELGGALLSVERLRIEGVRQ